MRLVLPLRAVLSALHTEARRFVSYGVFNLIKTSSIFSLSFLFFCDEHCRIINLHSLTHSYAGPICSEIICTFFENITCTTTEFGSIRFLMIMK